MKKSFEEVKKFLKDYKYWNMVSRAGQTKFSDSDFRLRESNESLIILRWEKDFGLDIELSYGFSLLLNDQYNGEQYSKRAFGENTLVEIDKIEFGRILGNCLSDLNFKYELKLHHGDAPLRYYKVEYPDPDNFIELIMETENLFIYTNWASAA